MFRHSISTHQKIKAHLHNKVSEQQTDPKPEMKMMISSKSKSNRGSLNSRQLLIFLVYKTNNLTRMAVIKTFRKKMEQRKMKKARQQVTNRDQLLIRTLRT